jgi:hypothetical protein
VADLRHVRDPFKWRGTRYFTAKFTGHYSPILFPARGLSRRFRRGGSERELPKPDSYNKPAGCSTSGALATGALKKKKKKKKKEEEDDMKKKMMKKDRSSQ